MSRRRDGRGRGGFTLMELLIVVLIIGVLTVLAIPQYNKTVENSRAEDALSTVQMIATTNRMFNLDKGVYAKGKLNSCDPSGTASDCSSASACNLMYCNYLGRQDLSKKPYNFYALDGSAGECGLAGPGGSNYSACAKRRASTEESGTDTAPFKDWGYTVTRDGKIERWPNDEKGPPKPP